MIKGPNKNNITSLGDNYKIVENYVKELKQTLNSMREKISMHRLYYNF